MTQRSRFLLVSRVGLASLHRLWLGHPGERGFDVLLSAYDPAADLPRGPNIMTEFRAGTKVAGYGALLRDHAATIARYDHVALFDDDLDIDAAAITRLFAIAADHELKIAQPALSHDSYFSYACLLRHPEFRLRFVNYIEMMCPVFRSDILLAVAPLFGLGFESGIDLVWCNLVGEGPRDFAVIDAVPVRHMRPVGSGKAANGFIAGRRYEDDIRGVLARFGLPWLPCVPFGAIRRDGRAITGRTAFFWPALRLMAAIGQRRPWRMRARNVAVYWKHLLRAPARNIRVDWPGDGAHL